MTSAVSRTAEVILKTAPSKLREWGYFALLGGALTLAGVTLVNAPTPPD